VPCRGYLCVALLLVVQCATAQHWVRKVAGSGLGNPLTYNPLNSDILYGSNFSNQIYVSRNRGYDWTMFGSPVPGGGTIKSIAISPLDTSKILCGVKVGPYDRIVKSTNGGATWTQTWGGTFSYFGKPVEFKNSHPDTVYTMGSDSLWRSVDFGSTWSLVTITTTFDAWCDAEIHPDSANILFVGDFTSGIWKSIDYGATWKHVYFSAGDGEIPSITIDHFNHRIMYASRYSGGGGILKSTDGGETWQCISTPIKQDCSSSIGGAGWWVTTSTVHPGYVYFGSYGAPVNGVFMSRDNGNSWAVLDSGLTSVLNYGLLALDTLTVIALQDDGIYKLQYPAVIQLLSPHGGEVYLAGTTQTIRWTASGIYRVNVDYTSDNGSTWTPVAQHVPAGQDSLSWQVASSLTDSGRIRITDADFTPARDSSHSLFRIFPRPVSLLQPAGGEVWNVGSTQSIRWQALPSIAFVAVSYSTDSGATWREITFRPSQAAAMPWTIPDAPSARCLVKIAAVGDSTLADTLKQTFTILAGTTFAGTIHVTGAGPVSDSLRFGMLAGSTDGIDTALGEAEAAPVPPAGTFDVRWEIPATRGTRTDFRDTLGGAVSHLYHAVLQPGGGGYPLSLAWSPESLRAGTFILRDSLTQGRRLLRDMRQSGSVQVGDSLERRLELLVCPHQEMALPVIDNGWSLLSIPLLVGDRRKDALLPYRLSDIYMFRSAYVRKDTIFPGEGFWVKSAPSSVTGCTLPSETLQVQTGWNLIGALTGPVAVSSLVTVPESLITSPAYGYTITGYQSATLLDPGRGYWVKTKGAGKIIFTPPLSKEAAGPAPALHSMTFRDGAGHTRMLQFGAIPEGGNAPDLEAPPTPPGEEGLNVSFLPNSICQMHARNIEIQSEYPISLKSSSEKIFFAWSVDNEKKFTYILIKRHHSQIVSEIPLVASGARMLALTPQEQLALLVRPRQRDENETVTARQFTLDELYPNPANPSATVRFTVPFDARVKIRVFTILGEAVTTLFSDVVREGTHSVVWDGRNAGGEFVSSGVYYLQMVASGMSGNAARQQGEFAAVRKVLLLR
jgi:hypothetical protein